jgi:hypothetical protein
MAELAVREGYLSPPDLPRGDCLMTRLYGEDGSIRLRIDHADPRILISAELLDDVAGKPSDSVALDTTGCCDCMMQDDYTKAVLKITAVNRTVIYRITEYVPPVHAYIAEWPD